MIYKIKRYIRPLYYSIRTIFQLNIVKTLYINFKTQPLRIAIKMPIFIYGKCIIHSLRGNLIIEAPIQKGMIKLGYKYRDLVPSSFLPSQITISNASLIFKGLAIISGGVSLEAAEGASLTIGNCCTIGGGSLIKAVETDIFIGENTRITYNCTIFNSNMHYVKNIQNGIIKRKNGLIFIGCNCWINANTYIAKSTILPDYCVTAQYSFLNKDYSIFGKNLFLIGSPAKPTNSKVQRILSISEEKRLNLFFKQHTKSESINTDPGLFIEPNFELNKF